MVVKLAKGSLSPTKNIWTLIDQKAWSQDEPVHRWSSLRMMKRWLSLALTGLLCLLFHSVDQLIMRLVPPWLCYLIPRHSHNGLFVLLPMSTRQRIRYLFPGACFEEISSGYIFTLPIKAESHLGENYTRSPRERGSQGPTIMENETQIQ